MVADKVNDEEIVREIRDAFLSLATNKNPIAEGKSYTRAEAARDLFKYALLTSSMYFERTGFALVFPEH